MDFHEKEELVLAWLDRAQEQIKPFNDVGTMARKHYGGEPEIYLSAIAPISHRNFFKEAVQTIRGKTIEGTPQVQCKANNDNEAGTAQNLQKELDRVYTHSSMTGIMQSMAMDVGIFFRGFTYIHKNGIVEQLYAPDVMIDNSLAKPYDIYQGRFIIIRRLVDANKFWTKWEKELKNLDYKDADGLPRATNVPCREIVGANTTIQLGTRQREENTSTVMSNLYGGPNYNMAHYATDGKLDALVEEYEVFIKNETLGEDGEDKVGWEQFYVFEDHLLADGEDVDPEWPGPPVTSWVGDYLGGQVYQPSLYVDVIRSQASYNYISSSAARILSYLENPVTIHADEDRNKNKGFLNLPGQNYYESVAGSVRPFPQPVPPKEYYTEKEYIRRDVEANTGINDAMKGNEPVNVTSGVAIDELNRNANTRLQSAIQSRNEWMRDTGRWILIRGKDRLGIEIATEQIWNDFIYSFRIIPPTTHTERIEQTLVAVVSGAKLLEGTILETDVEARIDVAGVITGNKEEAEELKAALKPRMEQAQQSQAQAAQDQAEMVAADKEQDQEDELEQIDAEGEIKVEIATINKAADAAIKNKEIAAQESLEKQRLEKANAVVNSNNGR